MKLKINNFINFVKNHFILSCMALLFICWLPYIIVFYPGTVNLDSIHQISQYFDTSTWTSHHPVFLTIVYGNFMRLGQILIDDNFGLFLNNITQVLAGTFLLSYCINYVYSLTKNKKIVILLFAFFAFFPTWPIHFYTEVKDIWFSMAFLLFVIYTIKFFKAEGNFSKLEWFIYFSSMVLTYLCRKNGVFAIILTFPFLAFVVKGKARRNIIICSLLAIFLTMTSIKVFMSVKNIKNGDIKEALSIPLHQTAYYYHTYALTDEESDAISKVVKLEDLEKEFIPESVDFVKAKSKKVETSSEDLKIYLITWFKMFFKHPSVYIKATLNSTYGYIYPNRTEYKDGIAQYTLDSSGIFSYANKCNVNLHFLEGSETSRELLQRFAYMTRNIPFIGLLFASGTYTWVLIALALLLIYFKKYKELVILIPLFVSILVCIASPVNAYVRYTLPIMMSLPFVLFILLFENNNIRLE